MSKHNRSKSINSFTNANANMNATGSIVTKSPGTESINKWKIPHYYKRAPSSMTNLNPLSSNNLSIQDLPNRSPIPKNITSPKKLILEDSNRKQPRSKKNGKDMVFVNYTVQDETNNQNNNILDQSNLNLPHESFESHIPPSIPFQSKPNGKQKSARKRMLKFFGSSKDRLTNNLTSTVSTTKSVYKPTPLNRSISTPTLSNEEMVMPSSNKSSKRGYANFLKYGKLGSSSSTINTHSISENTSFDDMLNEVVPKSNNQPIKNGYSNLSSSYLNDPQMNANVASIPLFNSKNINLDRKPMDLTNHQNKFMDFTINNNLMINGNASSTSLSSGSDTRLQPRQFSNAQQSNISPGSSDTFGISPSANLPNLNEHPSGQEENDASIAFSKMFTRKRTSIADSISSSRSSKNSISNSSTTIKPVNNNSNVNNQNTLSSMTNIYSPIRTASPARPGSSTRASSSYRLSRDFSSLSSVPDGPENTIINNNTYLDNQHGQMAIANNQDNMNSTNDRIGHKKKQESISDLHRHQQQTINNSVTTPSSMTFVTPPYFASNFAISSSNSTSSTPGVGDLNIVSGYLDGNMSMDNNQNNSMIEFSDIKTPLEYVPAIEVFGNTPHLINPMQRTTTPNIAKKARGKKNKKSSNKPEIVEYVPNNMSTSYSSAMDSVMTNSLSTTTTNTINTVPTNSGKVYQDQNGKPYTLVNTGLGLNDVNLNNFVGNNIQQKVNGRQINQLSQNTENINNLSDDQLIQQMYMEFEFENPGSIFHDQLRIPSNDQGTNLTVNTLSPALTSMGGPGTVSSPSTIVASNIMTDRNMDHSSSMIMNSHNYNDSFSNNNNNGQVSNFNTPIATTLNENNSHNNNNVIPNTDNDIARSFFLGN